MRSPSLTLAPDRSTGAVATRFVSASTLAAGVRNNVLVSIRFGRKAVASEDPREIVLPLDPVGGLAMPDGDIAGEWWTADRPVDFDRDDGFGFAHNGEILFGHLSVLEIELSSVAAAAFRAYARMDAFLERQGFPHLLRCWNFLHDINVGEKDAERYRQFCLGRYQALSSRDVRRPRVSAATAIGMHEPGLQICFIAARAPGEHVENPRQVPAFRYPRQYGPRSPSFARATCAQFGPERQLLVSGTASVVGHATLHPGDSVAQLDETLANINALLEHAAVTHLESGAMWAPDLMRLYLRDPSDAPLARDRLREHWGPDLPVLFLEGDICRRDLNLEIEGQFRPAQRD